MLAACAVTVYLTILYVACTLHAAVPCKAEVPLCRHKPWNHKVSMKVMGVNHKSGRHKAFDMSIWLWWSPWQVHDRPVCVAL